MVCISLPSCLEDSSTGTKRVIYSVPVFGILQIFLFEKKIYTFLEHNKQNVTQIFKNSDWSKTNV